MIRTAEGGEIPLSQAATLERDRSQISLQRHDGRRAITVSADTDPRITSPNEVARTIEIDLLPRLIDEFPGLEFQIAGQEEDMRESLEILGFGFIIAALVMYALMAIVFGSYLQPLLIVSAIPFGVAGAILGHLLMGYELSMISMFGIVALAGVVVNDSLVLVHLIIPCARGRAAPRGGDRRAAAALPTHPADVDHGVSGSCADDLRDVDPGARSDTHGHQSGFRRAAGHADRADRSARHVGDLRGCDGRHQGPVAEADGKPSWRPRSMINGRT
jgi:hypothetical protein